MNFSQNQIRVMEPDLSGRRGIGSGGSFKPELFSKNGHVISDSVSEFLHGRLGKLSEQE